MQGVLIRVMVMTAVSTRAPQHFTEILATVKSPNALSARRMTSHWDFTFWEINPSRQRTKRTRLQPDSVSISTLKVCRGKRLHLRACRPQTLTHSVQLGAGWLQSKAFWMIKWHFKVSAAVTHVPVPLYLQTTVARSNLGLLMTQPGFLPCISSSTDSRTRLK